MGGYVNRTKIAQLYADAESLGGQTVTVAGWVKSVRDMKNFGFVTPVSYTHLTLPTILLV